MAIPSNEFDFLGWGGCASTPKLTQQEMSLVTVVKHPLIQDMLTGMRNKKTETAGFWQSLETISLMLCFAATEDLKLKKKKITTPIGDMRAPVLSGKPPVFASIWRAGDGMLSGMRKVIPSASVSHIGLYRNEKTLLPETYYFKAPGDIAERPVITVDPMLATGGSANDAVSKLKSQGAIDIRFVCLLAAPEGIRALRKVHPDVRIFTAAIDKRLNEKGYIVPGLGDAGDRIFGTK